MKRQGQTLTLKTLTKKNVWNIQENDVFRLWSQAQRDADLKENSHHYLDIIKSAFFIEEVKVDKVEVIRKYEERGCKVGSVRFDNGTPVKWAIKKKNITRINDLNTDNIHHVSAAKLIEILERNFGGGWESLPQSVQSVIQSAFEVSTTTLPTERLKKTGGLYEMKLKEGFEILEITKGSWTEAIFVKELSTGDGTQSGKVDDEMLDSEGNILCKDDIEDSEIEEDEFDDDKLTEESYHTTFDAGPEVLEMESEDVVDDDF
nr:hypothetical protein [uncultured Prevotella sp.]